MLTRPRISASFFFLTSYFEISQNLNNFKNNTDLAVVNDVLYLLIFFIYTFIYESFESKF